MPFKSYHHDFQKVTCMCTRIATKAPQLYILIYTLLISHSKWLEPSNYVYAYLESNYVSINPQITRLLFRHIPNRKAHRFKLARSRGKRAHVFPVHKSLSRHLSSLLSRKLSSSTDVRSAIKKYAHRLHILLSALFLSHHNTSTVRSIRKYSMTLRDIIYIFDYSTHL